MDDPSRLAPGAHLGKYRLIEVLGRGGMGEVWRAHDPDLDRRVAVKVLHAATEDGQARLLREGRAMARLRHPNVITVYEATTATGRDLIAMELIDGGSLAGWLGAPRTRNERVRALVAAGRGLAAAHAAGMVHRDFKPHNVLVDRDGRVVVTDFGLARAVDAAAAPAAPAAVAGPRSPDVASADTVDATPSAPSTPSTPSALDGPLTRTGAVLGTPAYMAPEQLAGRAADARSDQFAFCVTAWEALAGARPFQGSSLAELQDAVAAGVPARGDQVPGRLRQILERGLAREPGRRWPSMDALLRALERAWRRPRRLAIASASIATVALAVAVPFALTARDRAGAPGPCPSLAEAFGALDGAEARATIDRLRAAPQAARAVAFLDRWRATWRDTYQATCRRSSEREFLARRACLESLRDHLASHLALVATVPPAMIASTDMVTLVAPPGLCLDHPGAIGPPEPAEPAIRAEIRRIRTDSIKYQVGVPLPAPMIAAALEQLVADARATGYLPVVADALTTTGHALAERDPGTACGAFEEAANVAENAGADMLRVHALFGLIDCAAGQPQRGREVDALIDRARGLIERIGDPALRAILDATRAWILGDRGDWDGAIAAAAAARAVWLELDAPIFAARAAVPLAQFQMLRHRGDDLVAAERALRDSLDLLPAEDDRRRALLRRLLGELLWIQGRYEEAIVIRAEAAVPAPTRGATVVVTVLGADGAPVRGAEVVAAVDPVGDPVRVVMAEVRATAATRTDGSGAATVTAPPGALILARNGYDVAAAPAPDRDGPIRLVLGPAGGITGHLSFAPAAPADPALGRRAIATVTAATTIAGRTWSVVAPVGAGGDFRIPLALPGSYAITAEASSARGDVQRGLARTTVAAGATTTVDLSIAAPIAVRAVLRPAAPRARLVAWPGHHAITTWSQVAARFARASHATAVATGGAVIEADGDARIGDGVSVFGAPGAGPVTVCLLAGATVLDATPPPASRPGGAAPPPRCVTADAVDGAITTVVIPTDR